MKIGILTGGGDCPGLNAVIRGAVRKLVKEGNHEIVGIKYGWKGLLENIYTPLNLDAVSGILHKGGTILRTSRTNPFKKEETKKIVLDNIKEQDFDAIIAVGGEDTLGVANKLRAEGINIVGVPKTIDNDLSGTDVTFGFDTALNIVTDALDRLHTTAESHNRVIVCEIMGRHAGWLACEAAIAGSADYVLIPELPFKIEDLTDSIKRRHERGKEFSIVAVSEGAKFDVKGDKDGSFVTQDLETDAFGHVKLGGIGKVIANEIEKRTGFETRHVVLGHIQRGGSPTAFDRILGTRYGVKAAELVINEDFGKMVSLKGIRIKAIPIEEGVKELRTLDMELYDIAKLFFD